MTKNEPQTIEMLDALTALEAMERMAEGASVDEAIKAALKTKADVDADPWHLERDGGKRIVAEVAQMRARAKQRHPSIAHRL